MKMMLMFLAGNIFNSDVSECNVAAVTNMRSMFYGARVFNSDISKWNVSAVMHMNYMFYSSFFGHVIIGAT